MKNLTYVLSVAALIGAFVVIAKACDKSEKYKKKDEKDDDAYDYFDDYDPYDYIDNDYPGIP